MIDFIKKSKTITQAKICEIKNSWIWAAILWRRVGEDLRADKCERIAQFIAEKGNDADLLYDKPVIIGKV